MEWVRDITSRIHAERDIENLVNNSPDIIAQFNTDLEHIYCNKTVEDYFGVPAEYFINKTFFDLAEDMPAQADINLMLMNNTLKKCLETRKKQQVELCFRLPENQRWFATRVVPEFNNEGRVESLLTVSQEITARKKAAGPLRESE